MKRLSAQQLYFIVISGLILIFVFSGFYRQYNAYFTETATIMALFLTGVGTYIGITKISDEAKK